MRSKTSKQEWQAKIDRGVSLLSKLGTQKHLTALRDGFALTIPITIAGAIAIFFITIVFGGWGANKTSLVGLLAHASGGTEVLLSNLNNSQESWKLVGQWATLQSYGTTLFGWLNSATLGSFSIYTTLLISYSMAIVRRNKSPILVTVVGLATFLVFTKADSKLFSAQGMIISIIASLIGTEIFMKLVDSKKLELKLPSSVPPAVGRSFGILFPAFVTIVLAGLANVLVSLPFIWMDVINKGEFISLSYLITTFVQAPFIEVAKSGFDIGLLFVYIFGACFLFFFGIHGPNTLNGIFKPIALLLWIDNLAGGTNVFTMGVVASFAAIGGTGSTLPLILLSMILLTNGSPTKEVSKFALPIGIFEVNEPVIFGYPIIFSPKWFLPYVLAPMCGLIWPVIAIKNGLMNPETIPAPWTTPPFIIGLIITQFDWRSIIVTFLSFSTIALVYFPFVLWQRKEDRELLKTKNIPIKDGA